MVRSAEMNHVSKIFVSSLGVNEWRHYPEAHDVAEANGSAFAFCARFPEVFRAYVYLNPNLDWVAELAKWRDNRFFVGVKLWISNKDENGCPDICLPLLERAAGEGFVVLIHSFLRWGRPWPGELTPPEIASLARRAPEARILLAHMGGQWQLGVKAVAAVPNICVDTSGGAPFRGMVAGAVRQCGIERVLFGSDVPCRTIQSQLYKVLAAGLPEAEADRVLRTNAERLFSTQSED